MCVTGGAGTVGAELVRQLVARYEPEVVRVLDHDEAGLARLERQLRGHAPRLRFLLGDVRDRARLDRVLEGIDVVLHTAAVKHVPLCEYNPFEAVRTNLVGTQNLVEAARAQGVERVVFTSTDKAVGPVSVMGASKLMAEKLLQAAAYARGTSRTVFACTRFGNVLDSRGSVVQVFREQISRGGPVTVTHPEMTRYLMSLADAAHLVLQAAQRAEGGQILVLKMPVVRIDDLARVMIHELAPRFGHRPEAVEVRYVGSRPGEKLYEELVGHHELPYAEPRDAYWVLRAANTPGARLERGRLPGAGRSDREVPLSTDEVALLLHRAGVF
jgi:FlaA1/EpsC-like NDP-sugar epimerase